MAFTLIPVLAFVLRIIIILSISKLYWSLSSSQSPVKVVKFSVGLAQPVGFSTAIFHGYLAVMMGAVFLRGMVGNSAVNIFLPLFVGASFLFFGRSRIKKPAEIKIKSNLEMKDGQQTLVLNPEESKSEEDPMKLLNNNMKKQLKENAQEFMQENTVIGLIGKITGVAIATMSLSLI
jgi:hypothetical protein